MKTNFDESKINLRKECLVNAEKELKKRFVGLDKVIDDVLNNIRTWYLFPELQDRPVIVNLIGMTGTGKTSLINELIKLLNMESKATYYNFGEIADMHTWDVENIVTRSGTSEPDRNSIFVYDEFQYAATLSKNGEEKDNRAALKVFWDLMDTGKMHKSGSWNTIYKMKRTGEMLMDLCTKYNIEVENLKWKEDYNFKARLTEPDYHRLCNTQFIRWDYNKEKSCHEVDSHDLYVEDDVDRCEDACDSLISPYEILNLHGYAKLYLSYEGTSNDFAEYLKGMNLYQLSCLYTKIYEQGQCGYDMDYSGSVIFILANVDEAYQMSYNMDPDMSPDQFHKITSKLTSMDIKNALESRFRNEQIARMGNIFIIYPAFSSDTFREIIHRNISEYVEQVREMYGVNLEMDDSVEDIIYKDSVFPTQGCRPLFSSIHEIVKSKLPEVFERYYEMGGDVDKVRYRYDLGKGEFVIDFVCDDKVKCSFSKVQKLHVESRRQTIGADNRCVSAVHESGHFFAYVAWMGDIPEKVTSCTVSSSNGGFVMPSINEERVWSKGMYMSRVRVLLAGYVAEKMVFGASNVTSGACNDLKEATDLVSTMFREFGFNGDLATTTYCEHPSVNNGGKLVKDSNAELKGMNMLIKNTIMRCESEVEALFKSDVGTRFIVNSSDYLLKKQEISKEDMRVMADDFYSSIDEYFIEDHSLYDKNNEFSYINSFNALKEKIERI